MPPYVFLDSWNSAYLFCTMEQHYTVHYRSGLIHQYWFVSVGKRNVIKCVQFSLLDSYTKVYNLSLMDWDADSGALLDDVVTDNGDTAKILKTVAICVSMFLQMEKSSKVYFVGNSPSRNRLYRMYIFNYYNLWEQRFICECLKINEVEFGFYFSKK
jgi:hypothetical protein